MTGMILEIRSISVVWNYIGHHCSFSFLPSSNISSVVPNPIKSNPLVLSWFTSDFHFSDYMVSFMQLFYHWHIKSSYFPHNHKLMCFKTGLTSGLDLCNSPETGCIHLLLIVSIISSAPCAIAHFLHRFCIYCSDRKLHLEVTDLFIHSWHRIWRKRQTSYICAIAFNNMLWCFRTEFVQSKTLEVFNALIDTAQNNLLQAA